jgi:hypothetical protein
MIDIFIPVLWICINANCEFMSPNTHYTSESKCIGEIDKQKKHMTKLVKKAGKGEITTMEGTCVTTQIESLKGKV